jgi:UDP-N-acetylenolpyruvoylglucosamine reductase
MNLVTYQEWLLQKLTLKGPSKFLSSDEIDRKFLTSKVQYFWPGYLCQYFIEINSTDDAIKFFKDKTHQNEVLLVLGGGSNVLFSERQFDGIIVKIIYLKSMS